MGVRSRIQSSVKNISYGLVVTVLNTMVSFVSRTILVKSLGAEVLGLNGLFTEIITVLSLTEMGVGMAIVYSLYKPIHENNYLKISQLISLYRSAYTAIAVVTLILGVALMPFVHNFITDVNYPLRYIRVIFLLFVIRTASSYLFSYKTSLLNADQKQYIVSLAAVIIKLIITIIIAIGLMISHNYVVYLVLMIVQSLATNIILSLYVDKHYPHIVYNEKLDKRERKEVFVNIRNIFIKRVSGVITSSTDNILISKLVSTIQVGLYSNYIFLFSVVRTLKQQFTNGIAASIGSLSVSSDSEHCINVLDRLTFLYFFFGMIMTSGLMAVSNAFISMWLGEAFVMDNTVVYLAVFNLFLEICCDPLWQYLEVSGLFKKDKNIAIIGSATNLIVSILLGIRIGIIGILLGTVCTQVIQMVLKTKLIFQEKFLSSPRRYYSLWIKMLLGYCALLFVQCGVISEVVIENIYVEFVLKGVIAVVVAVILVLTLFLRSDEYRYSKELFSRLLRKVIKRGDSEK